MPVHLVVKTCKLIMMVMKILFLDIYDVSVCDNDDHDGDHNDDEDQDSDDDDDSPPQALQR